jgi:hypothetical protein
MCTTVVLAVALAGLSPGTCVLQCDIRNAWVRITSSDGREGSSATSTGGSTCATSMSADGFGPSSRNRRSADEGKDDAAPTQGRLAVLGRGAAAVAREVQSRPRSASTSRPRSRSSLNGSSPGHAHPGNGWSKARTAEMQGGRHHEGVGRHRPGHEVESRRLLAQAADVVKVTFRSTRPRQCWRARPWQCLSLPRQPIPANSTIAFSP